MEVLKNLIEEGDELFDKIYKEYINTWGRTNWKIAKLKSRLRVIKERVKYLKWTLKINQQ